MIGVSGPTVTASFAYDAIGRRIAKRIDGVTTAFHYDGENVSRESGEAGEASYLRTLIIDEALTRTDPVGIVGILGDPLRNAVALTASGGTVVTDYTYEPFGTTRLSGLSSSNPYQFTGRENDGGGLYYYRARYYDPRLSRFLNPDPLGLSSGVNLYRYASNNPLRFVDPMGLNPIDSGCEDCPSGQWKIDIKHGINVGLLFGFSRTVVNFICVDNGKRCRGYVDCGSVGLQAQAGVTIASTEFEAVGTGSTVRGFSSSEQLRRGFTSFGSSVSVSLRKGVGLSTVGNNIGLDIGFGGGIAYQGCFIQYLFCER